MNSLQVRIRATNLRRKFEGHAPIVRQIVAQMTDAELVHEFDQFEADRLRRHENQCA
jgi:hypothetical protein